VTHAQLSGGRLQAARGQLARTVDLGLELADGPGDAGIARAALDAAHALDQQLAAFEVARAAALQVERAAAA
jgi:hypothetical protein